MKIGYVRVSTEDQDHDAQRQALKAAGCDIIFTDKLSGSLKTRPGLSRALATVPQGGVLVVWRLDRLGRSLAHLIETLTILRDQKIGLLSLQEQIDTMSAGGRFYLHMIAALAEFARELIRERTKTGMQAAKQRGVRLGRPPKLSPEQIETAGAMIAGGMTPRAVAAKLKVDTLTLRRAMAGKE